MKTLLNILGAVLTVVMIIWEIAELLAVPALLCVVGAVNGFGWQYYVISIGAYIALLLLCELLGTLIFRHLERKWTPILQRLLRRISSLFSRKDGDIYYSSRR